MNVYVDPMTINCRKVLAGLKLLDVGYTLMPVNYLAAEHKSTEYLALNPNGSLPVIQDGDFTLWESNAILQYAADKFEREVCYPREAQARADINRWLLWESSSWMPTCYVYLRENCVKPFLGGETDHVVLASEAENFAKLAGILDARLASSSWLCGDAPTIADIAVAAPMHLHFWSGLPLHDHPHLQRWMTDNVEPLSAWKQTHVAEGFIAQPID